MNAEPPPGHGLSRVRRNQESFGLYPDGSRTDDRLMDANTDEVVPRLGREFIQDPYSLYRRLHASGPVHPVTIWHGTRVWLISRYEHAKSLLSDRRLSKRQSLIEAQFAPGAAGPVASPLFANMLFSDPPDHTRLRKIVTATGAFTGASITQWRPKIVRVADELLDRIAGHADDDTVDLMAAYAEPLPIRVIGALLGVPAEDHDAFHACVAPFISAIDAAELATANSELTDLLTRLIAQKRRAPADDLLSTLVAVTADGDRFTKEELVAMAFLLISAGYETTVNLLGNGILALLCHPSQLLMLRQDRTLIRRAIEEFLRYESPVNTATLRVTTADIAVGEAVIPAHELVLIALSAANRDDREFSAPDVLDITRDAKQHLAFGYGTHYCLGAPLARLEAEIAFDRLLNRFDPITLDVNVDLRYRDSLMMRGLVTLPVHLGDGRLDALRSAS